MRDYLDYEIINKKNCDYEILFDNSNPNAKLSYVITTFNRFDLLKRCVNSIARQKKSIEFTIVISDNNIDTINDFKKDPQKYNFFMDKPVIYLVNKENIGGGANCNQAIFLSKTEYITVVHDDDVIHPMHTYFVNKILTEYPETKYVSFGIYKIDMRKSEDDELFFRKTIDKNNKIEKIEAKKLYVNYYCQMHGALISRDAFLNVGGLGKASSMEDYVLTYKIYEKYGGFFWNLKLYGYTILENDSLNNNIWNEILVEKYNLRKYMKKQHNFNSIPNFIYLCRDIAYFETKNSLTKMKLDKKNIAKKTNTNYFLLVTFTLLLKILRLIKGGSK